VNTVVILLLIATIVIELSIFDVVGQLNLSRNQVAIAIPKPYQLDAFGKVKMNVVYSPEGCAIANPPPMRPHKFS